MPKTLCKLGKKSLKKVLHKDAAEEPTHFCRKCDRMAKKKRLCKPRKASAKSR